VSECEGNKSVLHRLLPNSYHQL